MEKTRVVEACRRARRALADAEALLEALGGVEGPLGDERVAELEQLIGRDHQ